VDEAGRCSSQIDRSIQAGSQPRKMIHRRSAVQGAVSTASYRRPSLVVSARQLGYSAITQLYIHTSSSSAFFRSRKLAPKVMRIQVVLLIFSLLSVLSSCSFVTPPPRNGGGRGRGSSGPPRIPPSSRGGRIGGDGGGFDNSGNADGIGDLLAGHPQFHLLDPYDDDDDDVEEDSGEYYYYYDGDANCDSDAFDDRRLRASSSSKKMNPSENVVKGAQATLSSTTSYWKEAFGSAASKVTAPFRFARQKLGSVFQSKAKKQELELMKQLQTMPVRHVTVPNTTVLPADVVNLAAKRSGVLGSPLRMDRVQDFAQSLKRWYSRKGYVLHSVTGATLRPETATAEIAVQEPVISKKPVGITFCKQMVVDEETGDLLTYREYKDKHEKRRTFGYGKIRKADLNTTYVPVENGRTKPSRLASALGLKPGKPFQWDGARWRNIVSSGIFGQVLRAAPQPMGDGTVQLHIVATEAPPRHLEYGLGRSLYTGSWEGELEFEHGNLLGGGETLGLTVRRGTTDAFPSVRVGFSDNRFGMAGGYDVQVFRDFLGTNEASSGKSAGGSIKKGFSLFANMKKKQSSDGDSSVEAEPVESEETKLAAESSPAPSGVSQYYDPVLDRKGVTCRINNPITQKLVTHSVASASVERTTTKAGVHENIASTTVTVGPFIRRLPFDARSNVDVTITAGTRMSRSEAKESEGKEDDNSSSVLSGTVFFPYSSMTASTKQIFPIISVQGPSSERRPVVLALRHAVTASTSTLPRHEAAAQGLAANIRGAPPNGLVASSLRGTTELRVPVNIPIVKDKIRQDANMVVFGDWLVGATADASNNNLFRKTSLGFGLRKSFQGVPLQVDLTYSKELKLKTSFGLGRDFDV